MYSGGEIKIMGLDNIADEQKAKAELGVVFDTNYFSDDIQNQQLCVIGERTSQHQLHLHPL